MKQTLQNSTKAIQKKVGKLLRASSFNDDMVVPFEEKEDMPENPADKRPCAHDLFSMFTADVIKERTLFTR